jgi:hypothetical protein
MSARCNIDKHLQMNYTHLIQWIHMPVTDMQNGQLSATGSRWPHMLRFGFREGNIPLFNDCEVDSLKSLPLYPAISW